MKLLFIGGTGLISSACSALAAADGHEVWMLNRGATNKYDPPHGTRLISADINSPEADIDALLEGLRFDCVIDFLTYTPAEAALRLKLFSDRCRQFIFISSASAYQKPPRTHIITEETPLANPFWQYSRDKIASEQLFMDAHRTRGFPITVVRPSLTYGPSQIPIIGASWQHPYTIVDRIRRGLPVIVPGDGTSLWVLTWNADFAVGLRGLIGNPAAVGETYQITSDEVLTWNQIVQELYAALGVEANIVHVSSDLIIAHDPGQRGTLLGDKIYSAVFDNGRIKSAVPDFNCKVLWRDGVRRSLDWFAAAAARRTVDGRMNAMWDQILEANSRALPARNDEVK